VFHVWGPKKDPLHSARWKTKIGWRSDLGHYPDYKKNRVSPVFSTAAFSTRVRHTSYSSLSSSSGGSASRLSLRKSCACNFAAIGLKGGGI
jgi:hypothetical protein